MKKIKSVLSLILTLIMIMSTFATLSVVETSAATYAKIPALQISRVYQPHTDTDGHCYWASMATVQGYCLGSYTYGGVTTDYRVPGQDYNYLSRGDALSKFCQTLDSSTYANNANNLTKKYPIKMTRVTEGIGKNAATYKAIYDQLALGKPVIIYTGTHASVVIGYSGSSTTLDPKGFTVLEIKKDKANTSSGYWWVNSANYYNKHANSPQIDSNTLKTNGTNYMSCYVNLQSWIEYCGNKVQEICYPTNALATSSAFSFNANGGTGSIPAMNIKYGDTIAIPENSFNYTGYTFAGYNVCRTSDNAWYCNAAGWQSLQKIRDNNYERKVYTPGETYGFGAEWLRNGGVMGTGFVFYPIWKPTKTTLDFYGNYSNTNYMMSFDKDNFEQYYQSRDNSVYTVSLYEELNSSPSLVIEGKTAGTTGKDLLFKTQTNKSPNYNFNAGDNKSMLLRFRAKSSVDGAKMFIRWGYTSDTTSITLSTQWQEYTIDMSKQVNDGAHMHPYFDKAGTFYISDITLTDAKASAPTQNETSDLLYTKEYTVGSTYGELPTPVRSGYAFRGWYTSKYSGVKITKDTVVFGSNLAVYARWIKADFAETILMGDTDLSGTINVKDATLIQKGLAGITTLTEKQSFCGNVITSDVLNIRDATAIQKWCAGMDAGNAIVNEKAPYLIY
ncbi:MAG: InlB B-repeat-containing protein [Ruminococcus sp.]|nr:InlB B-repeat-containing protein [Ruminococcus sp.]